MLTNVWQLILFYVIILAPLPLAYSAIVISEARSPRHSVTHSLLIAGLAWCMIETAIALLLGLIHHLNLASVITMEILIAVLGFVLIIRMHRISPWASFTDFAASVSPLSRAEVLVVGMLAFLFLVQFAQLLLNPTLDYDSLSYHLPVIAGSYNAGAISVPIHSNELQNYYPYDWEIMSVLFVMPFKNDLLIVLPSLIAWALLGLAIYRLACEFGAWRPYALSSAALALSMPLVAGHINSAHIDLPFTLSFLSSCYFGLIYARTRSFPAAACCIALVGMLIGLKTSGVVYALAPAALLCAGLMRANKVSVISTKLSESKISNAVWGAGGMACFALLGGYWLVRNYIGAGNPFGLMEVRILGTTIFPGSTTAAQIRGTTLAAIFNITSIEHWHIFLKAMYMAMGIPILVILSQIILCTLRPGRSKVCSSRPITLILGIVFTSALYWLTPFSGHMDFNHDPLKSDSIARGFRYAFPAIGFLAVFGAVCATSLRISKKTTVALILLSIAMITYKSRLMPFGTTALLMWIFYHTLLRKSLRAHWHIRKLTLLLIFITGLLVISPIAMTFINEKRTNERVLAYGGCSEFITKYIPASEQIGYMFSHESYLYYGSDLSRKVVYIAPKSGDMQQWVNTLRKQGISIVAAGPLIKKWRSRPEIRWLNNARGPFVRIYGKDINDDPVLYKLKDE